MWNLRPEERLREWKDFRRKIGTQPLAEACQSVTHLWSYAPYVNYYIDPDRNSSTSPWPDPWTLLYENYYCDVAKALGMLYTLYLSDHKPNDIELLLGVNEETREPCNLVSLAQGKYILNLEFDTVVNSIPEHFKVRYRYQPDDLDLDQY